MAGFFKIFPRVLLPVPCGAMTVIGVSTLPKKEDEPFITMVKEAIPNIYQPRKK